MELVGVFSQLNLEALLEFQQVALPYSTSQQAQDPQSATLSQHYITIGWLSVVSSINYVTII